MRWPWIPLVLSACHSGKQPVDASPILPPAPSPSAAAKPSGILFDPEIIRGTYPIALVSGVLHDQTEAMRACSSNRHSGTVAMTFVISQNGAVATVKDDGSDFPEPDAVRCVLNIVLRLEFRPPKNEDIVVRYRLGIGSPK